MLPRAGLLIIFGLAVAFAYHDDYSYNRRYSTNETDYQPKTFCYINGSRINAQMRMSSNQFTHFSINDAKRKSDLCNVIIYGGAVLDPHSYGLRPIGDMEQGRSSNKISFEEIAGLKEEGDRKNTILISVSGEAADFSKMAKYHRKDFINHAKEFFSKYKFDGLVIDWKYPTRRGGVAEDKQNYALLMQELEIAFRSEAKEFGVSLSPLKINIEDGYDYTNFNFLTSVDYFFIMAFEYYGQFSNTVGANAPIRSGQRLNVENTLNELVPMFKANKSLYKLVLVIPFYGKMYQLHRGIGDDENPIGKEFKKLHGSLDTNTMSYREICQKMNSEQGWRQGYDNDAKTPYIVKDMFAVVYENAESVAEKTALALRNRLGGVMAFSLDMDDYVGDCSSDPRRSQNNGYGYNNNVHDHRRVYPLLQAMHDTLERGFNAAGLSHASFGLVILLAGLVAGLRNFYA